MKYRALPGTGLHVSEVCLGSMTWGEQNSEADAHEQLDYAVARGINFIDTAEMYPAPPNAVTQGRTETYLGNWLARRPRDGLVIATKVAGPGRRDWIRGGRTDLTREIIGEVVDTSLARLQIDCIDLYQRSSSSMPRRWPRSRRSRRGFRIPRPERVVLPGAECSRACRHRHDSAHEPDRRAAAKSAIIIVRPCRLSGRAR